MGDAARAALCLTPIGEFSLIIALTGVEGELVPSSFYALAIGVCLLTSLTTPFLIRNSQAISDRIQRKQPEFLAQWIGLYHDWIESLKQRQRSSMLWKLTAPRFIQVTLSVLFISGILIFTQPLYALAVFDKDEALAEKAAVEELGSDAALNRLEIGGRRACLII